MAYAEANIRLMANQDGNGSKGYMVVVSVKLSSMASHHWPHQLPLITLAVWQAHSLGLDCRCPALDACPLCMSKPSPVAASLPFANGSAPSHWSSMNSFIAGLARGTALPHSRGSDFQ